MAMGGSASSFRDMTAGSGSGLGRIQKTSIASKTKAQKLKVGGMVKGYYNGGVMGGSGENRSSGGDYLSEGDRLAMKNAGLPEGGDRGMGMAAYRARQAKREMDAAARRAMINKSKGEKKKGTYTDDMTFRGNEAFRLNDMNNDNAALRGGSTDLEAPLSSPISPYNAQSPYASSGMKRGGVAKYAAGGKMSMKDWEGSAEDLRQDKKLAKKRGESLADWEKSSEDTKHDKQQSMKGLKKGGKAKMAKGGKADGFAPMSPIVKSARSKGIAPMRTAAMPLGMAGNSRGPTDIPKYAAGGMSTAMDGMKKPLRPLASGMKKGGMTEGSPRDEARDMREDKPQAKKAKMSMSQFENSSKDIDKMAKGGHAKGCNCMACGGKAKYAKGGKVTFGSMKPLPGTKTKSFNIMPQVASGNSTKPLGSKAGGPKASGAKPTSMMKPLGMTKMAKGGKVRGAGIAQRGTKFIGEV